MRINGFSGIDVDTMVKEMMKPYNIKVDREKQQRDLVSWKQDLYRDVTKNMKGLYNKYFDVLSKDYLLSPNKLSSTKVESKDSSIVDVSGLSGAKTGTYNVNIDKLATSAQVTSDVDIKTDGIKTKLDISGLEDSKDGEGKILRFNINGRAKEVVIKNNSGGVTVEDLMNSINGTLKDSGIKASYSEFSGKVTIENTKTGSNSSLEIGGLDNIKLEGSSQKLFKSTTGSNNYSEIDIASKLTVGDETKLSSLGIKEFIIPKQFLGSTEDLKIEISDGETVASLKDKINSQIKGNTDIKLNFENGKMFLTNDADGESKQLDLINVNNVKAEDKTVNFTELKICGETINIDPNNTLKDVISKINDARIDGLNVNVSSNTIVLQNSKSIIEAEIDGTKDNIKSYSVGSNNGTDAEFSIKLPDGTECTGLTSETNIFTKDNLTFTFNNTGETTFTVKNDVSGPVDKITEFIDDYNNLVGDMYSKVTTKKNKMGEYLPLTADQKKEMSEDEIKVWEAKGKNGLLKGDMLLNSILGDMRGIFDSYTGMGKELTKIGISLSSDTTKPNVIEIDKDKLTKALENDGENVISMLISTEKEPSKKPNGDPIVDKDGKPIMISKGAFSRLKDTTYNACITYKSTLSEKAGIDGSTGDELSKAIAKRNEKIKEMEKDLKVREQAFYVKFSRLEQAMSKLNSQQSALSQQFGGM